MKQENYILVAGWMVKDLGLRGNELLAYALIFGFSQDGSSCFSGSAKYIAEWLNIDRRNALAVLNRLVEKGLVVKGEKFVNGVKLCDYRTALNNDEYRLIMMNAGGDETSQGMMKHHRGSDETSRGVVMKHHRGGDETSHHNIEDNIIDNINNNIYMSNKLDKSEILSLWNRLAEKWGLSKINIVSDERQKKITERLKDSGCETLYEMFKRIDEAIMGSIFLRGKKQRWMNGEWVLDNADWRPDFDFFTQKSKFIKAIDGGYDDKDVIEKKNEGRWEQYKNWMNKNWGEF